MEVETRAIIEVEKPPYVSCLNLWSKRYLKKLGIDGKPELPGFKTTPIDSYGWVVAYPLKYWRTRKGDQLESEGYRELCKQTGKKWKQMTHTQFPKLLNTIILCIPWCWSNTTRCWFCRPGCLLSRSASRHSLCHRSHSRTWLGKQPGKNRQRYYCSLEVPLDHLSVLCDGANIRGKPLKTGFPRTPFETLLPEFLAEFWF